MYVNAHGGGFVIRYPERDDPLCRYLALRAGVAVLNVDYVVAPRHRFPDPVEQLCDVVCWAAGATGEWDGARLCVGGQSAGGALAAGAARLALESGGPRIALQVLHYAPLDLVTVREPGSGAGGRSVVPIWMAEMFHTAYIREPAQRHDRLASPAWEANGDGIEGIAAALVITPERDPLRAGGAAYAGKLAAAGCLAAYRDVPGADHGYDIVGNDEGLIRQMYDVIVGHVIEATGG
ncbi:MAG: alpha/beta hydrolase fold domain-containing protein [Deinococcales bacterium]